MRTRLDLLTVILAALGALLSACGGSAPAETTADQLKGAPPPLLPLPTDPWAVIPDGDGVLTLDVAAVRASPHAEFLRQLAHTHCFTPEQEALLFDRTDRVIATGRAAREAAGDEGSVLVVLKGRYAERDAQLFADSLAAHDKGAAAEQVHKRVRILRRGEHAVARIGDGLMALGTAAHVEQAAALAEGEQAPLLADSALLAGSVRDEIAADTAVVVGHSTQLKVQRAARSLGAVGLPQDLLNGPIFGRLKLTASGADVVVRVTKDSAQLAAEAAGAIQRKLGQLALLARLAGLPPILDKTEARASDAVLEIALSASNADLEVLRGRLAEALGEAPAACPP